MLIDARKTFERDTKIVFEDNDAWPDWKERIFFWALLAINFLCLYGIIKLVAYFIW